MDEDPRVRSQRPRLALEDRLLNALGSVPSSSDAPTPSPTTTSRQASWRSPKVRVRSAASKAGVLHVDEPPPPHPAERTRRREGRCPCRQHARVCRMRRWGPVFRARPTAFPSIERLFLDSGDGGESDVRAVAWRVDVFFIIYLFILFFYA